MTNTDNDIRAAWFKLPHIGAHQGSVGHRPDLDELGIDEVHRICSRLWVYSRADFEPSFRIELRNSQWRETCALAGSIAESLMLSAAAYIEAVWHDRAIAAMTEQPGMGLAQRYLADTAVDTTITIGHRLINFVVRAARTAPATRDRLGEATRFRYLGPQYIPFETDDRRAWLSLNDDTISNLRSVIPSLHADSLDILARLVHSPQWTEAFDIRAGNFHRWRKEHESVYGVDQNSGRATDRYNDGNLTGRAVGSRPRPHTISNGLTERTALAAGAGIQTVAAAAEAVLDDTLSAVLPQIENGFSLAIDHNGKSKTTIRFG